MNPRQLSLLRSRLRKLWLISPERLWLFSIALHRRGHWVLAFWVKQLNTILYHNSLSPGASVSPDISLGHYSHGIVINSNTVIGQRVNIWHNVTLTGRREASRSRAQRRTGSGRSGPGSPARILVEDDVMIGVNAVIVAPRGRGLRIGRGARIGAGAVVTEDVPAGATVVCTPVRVLLKHEVRTASDGEAASLGPTEPGMG